MHFLNRIGAIILLICVAAISHAATLYVACGSVPALVFWVICPILVLLGLYMWLKDWHDYMMFSFKWYDK
jgi:hypothetical protein